MFYTLVIKSHAININGTRNNLHKQHLNSALSKFVMIITFVINSNAHRNKFTNFKNKNFSASYQDFSGFSELKFDFVISNFAICYSYDC